MKTVVATLSALAEPTRLAALAILWDGSEHCVCELMTKLGATESRMSRHIGVLKAAGLVTGRRDAQWMRYRRDRTLQPSIVGRDDEWARSEPERLQEVPGEEDFAGRRATVSPSPRKQGRSCSSTVLRDWQLPRS
jgi:ArsR family transcriptional regulator, arsenate/arsenite/antimonite-responsive transcriptional repressor